MANQEVSYPLVSRCWKARGTLTSLLISLRAVYNVWEILVAILINLLLIYVVLRSTRHDRKDLE